MARKCLHIRENDGLVSVPAWRYTWERYKKYFPHCLFSFVMAFILRGIHRGYGFKMFAGELIRHLPEIALIHTDRVGNGASAPYNNVTWSISVMLIVGYFVWYCLCKMPKIYLEVVCPATVIIIYPYLYQAYGFIGEPWSSNTGIISASILRCFVDINLGILCMCLARKTREQRGIYNQKHMEWISDICLLSGGILMPYLYSKTTYDFLFLFLIACGIFLGFYSGNTVSGNNTERKVIDRLSGIVLAVYLNNLVFASAFKSVFSEINVWVYMGWFVFITAYSFFTTWFVNKTLSVFKNKVLSGYAR